MFLPLATKRVLAKTRVDRARQEELSYKAVRNKEKKWTHYPRPLPTQNLNSWNYILAKILGDIHDSISWSVGSECCPCNNIQCSGARNAWTTTWLSDYNFNLDDISNATTGVYITVGQSLEFSLLDFLNPWYGKQWDKAKAH